MAAESSRFTRVEELFFSALERPPENRSTFLDEACGGDESLRSEVQELLDSESEATTFLESVALGDFAAPPGSYPDTGISPNLVGRHLGHHEVLSLIGRGGMGEVYRARNLETDRMEAIKIVPGDLAGQEDRLRRFWREAKVVAVLDHPGIARMLEIGNHEGRPFLVMEYVDGRDLRSILEGALLSADDTIAIIVQVLQALDYSHRRGIIHRDIKPSNIMVTPTGQAVVLDFGLAKFGPEDPLGLFSVPGTSSLTRTGTVIGTVGYMSPEQVRGLELDRRTDLFSLGVVFYEMLAGRPPFLGATFIEVFDQICRGAPVSLTRFNPALAPLEAIVDRCLAKDCRERFRSAGEILELLGSGSTPWSRIARARPGSF